MGSRGKPVTKTGHIQQGDLIATWALRICLLKEVSRGDRFGETVGPYHMIKNYYWEVRKRAEAIHIQNFTLIRKCALRRERGNP
jgi:hypothetical protein